MDTCTVETGLLKKKPCGEKAVTKCGNCEQPLCSKHAAGRMSAGKKIFLCPDCAKAWKEMGEAPAAPVAKPAPAPKPAAPAAAPAAAAAKPKEAPKEEKKDDGGALEFTPSKKPEEKK